MEQVEVLIHKLTRQVADKELPAQLLPTVQQLYAELIKLHPQPEIKGSKNVAVVMPLINFHLPVEETNTGSIKQMEMPPPQEIKEPNAAPVNAATVSTNDVGSANETYSLRKPVIHEDRRVPVPASKIELPFDAMEEVPTLKQQAPLQKELHELLGEKKESLNDKLKSEHNELGQALKHESIKDLRKGIGVNDKFLFINELFRGDEAMYERSIKTINSFHILPEAEYWINRELKVKQGWNDTAETVQHFYAVVRRRFS